MNAENTVNSISDLRAWLDSMGVTPQGLAITALIATVIFIFSLREVLSWYLKVQHLRSDMRQMRAQMTEMQKSVEQMREMLLLKATTPDELPAVDETPAQKQTSDETPATDSKRFNFDH